MLIYVPATACQAASSSNPLQAATTQDSQSHAVFGIGGKFPSFPQEPSARCLAEIRFWLDLDQGARPWRMH